MVIYWNVLLFDFLDIHGHIYLKPSWKALSIISFSNNNWTTLVIQTPKLENVKGVERALSIYMNQFSDLKKNLLYIRTIGYLIL